MLKRIYYGWIIAALSFFVIAMNGMTMMGFGVFVKPLTEQLGWNRGDLSTVYSIAVLMGGILSLVSGRLTDRFSPRILMSVAGVALAAGYFATSHVTEIWQLYLTFAIPVGLTISCTVIPVNSTIPKWFVKQRGLAMSIPAVGFSVGGVIGPIVMERLIDATDWQHTFLILAILPLAITLPAAQFIKNPPDDIDETVSDSGDRNEPAKSQKFPFRQILQDKWLWAFCGLQFTFGFSAQMIFVHVAPYATDVGLSPGVAAGILSFSSAIGIFGNLIAGSLADRMNARLLMVGGFALLTVSLVILLLSGNTFLFYLFAFVFGFSRGAVALLQAITAVDNFGIRYFGFYMGTFLLCGTSGGMVGTPTAGYIFDASNSYSAAFLMAIGFGCVAVFLSTLILRHKKAKI